MKNLILIMCLVVFGNCLTWQKVTLSSKSNERAILAPSFYEIIENDSFYDMPVSQMLERKLEGMSFNKTNNRTNAKFLIRYEVDSILMTPYDSKSFIMGKMILTKSDYTFKHSLRITFLSLDGKTKIYESLAYHLSKNDKLMVSLPALIEASFSDYPKSFIEFEVFVNELQTRPLENLYPSYY